MDWVCARVKSSRSACTASRSAITTPHSQLGMLSMTAPGGRRSLCRKPPGLPSSVSPIRISVAVVVLPGTSSASSSASATRVCAATSKSAGCRPQYSISATCNSSAAASTPSIQRTRASRSAPPIAPAAPRVGGRGADAGGRREARSFIVVTSEALRPVPEAAGRDGRIRRLH
jgi:hypothetical protein